ncbi:MAG: cisplatin damage response ATP-dependent DNA ligase, partial [Acidocella sp.]|nr:cisplatin damage response ATP-dependent DNA ligase [Acidocella sp.]
AELFAWVEGRAPRPQPGHAPVFRPVMLAHPLETENLDSLDWQATRAEWKYDGIRVQLVSSPAGRRLYSRNAEDISDAFHEIIAAMDVHATLDGELLVIRDGEIAPFADLQRRLGRKAVSAATRAQYPAGIMLYDILFDGPEDLRPFSFDARRARLEHWFAMHHPPRMSLSPLLAFTTREDLAALRATASTGAIEGLMLKDAQSPYLAGRPRGLWWKWKRDPRSLDAVLMYAQRGHGKRSSYYSDYTFGVWAESGELVPVAKAYSGYTDAELTMIDRWVRAHTITQYGPVREVEKSLVFELGFDAAQASPRHKSGVALRFPRILRLRPDKSADQADRLASILAIIPP